MTLAKEKPYTTAMPRIPELDGLRVLLVFIVAWFHIWQQSWLNPQIGHVSLDFLVRAGYFLVDGTVFLSAFLLFLPYARAMRGEGEVPDRRKFYQRRMQRTFPSYYFLILLTFFAIALPYGLYHSMPFLVKDLFTHLTFTFTFSFDTYVTTPLGAAYWTLAIEWQAYLLFPFIARWVMKRRWGMLLLAAGAFLWRGYAIWAYTDYPMVVNQLPAFLDVYALGMATAMVFLPLQKWVSSLTRGKKWAVQTGMTLLVAGLFILFTLLIMAQAKSPDTAAIQRGQMERRPLQALLMAGLTLTLPFALWPVRFLFGNRLMTFLSGVSLNFYMIHQGLAVHLRRIGFPPSNSPEPNVALEQPWQSHYTYYAFGLSLIMAILVTYLIEKPGGRLLKRWMERRDAPAARPAVQTGTIAPAAPPHNAAPDAESRTISEQSRAAPSSGADSAEMAEATRHP